MTKFVYLFAEGNKEQKDLLGGKGANLAEMTNAGLPVPAGFTISTDACRAYYKGGEKVPHELDSQMMAALKAVEKQTGKQLGGENPLLLSVRSGAKFSMPGMMDTVLNLGLNDTTVLALEKKSKNPRFAWDSYRRFIQMFSDVVIEIHVNQFEELLHRMKEKKKSEDRSRPRRERPPRTGLAVQGPGPQEPRQGLPDRSAGTAQDVA
jgi:pyruvate,orthophosphate dikinase